jgi:hypothetical protein
VRSVAKAIKYIADNLDQLVSTLTFAAQAFIAYKAMGMAAVFLEKANSVRAASIAVQQETVALTTNTQAQLVNANAARANAAAHTGVQSAASTLFPTFTKLLADYQHYYLVLVLMVWLLLGLSPLVA